MAMLVAARRAYVVVLLGVAATVLAALDVASTPGVYWSQVDVVFLVTPTETRPNPLGYSSQRLVDFASVIQRDITQDPDRPEVVSPIVTLADSGVRDGWWVWLPNYGGQWTMRWDRPALDVQVVGHDEGEVRAQMTSLLDRITQDVEQRQDAAGVKGEQRVTTSVSPPPAVEVHYLEGAVKRGLAMTVLLGLGLTLAAADWCDRRRVGTRLLSRWHERGARLAPATRAA
jgi:hypothetical protein